MTDSRKHTFARWLGIPAVIVIVLVLSACHYHLRRHHHIGDGGHRYDGQQYYGAYR